MKKNISINLFGTLYAIDEDAYNLLERYLDSMKSYFSRQEGGDEIADDIEHRVAELLWQEKEKGAEAVNIEMIKDIISKIGDPAQIDSENESTVQPSEPEQTKDSSNAFAESNEERNSEPKNAYSNRSEGNVFENIRQGIKDKRLYRDPQNKMIGGVCSGLARYFKSDVTIWRLGMVLAALLLWWSTDVWWIPGLLGWIVPVAYLTLCFVVPVARTPEDNLRMRGEEVSPQNINEEILRESNVKQQNMYSQPTNNSGSGCLKALVIVATIIVIFPLLIGTLGLIFALPFFSGLFSSGIFGHIFGNSAEAAFFGDLFNNMQGLFGAMLVCMLLLCTIPLALIILIIRGKKISGTSILCWGIVWLVALIIGIFFTSKSIGNIGNAAINSGRKEWSWHIGPYSYTRTITTTLDDCTVDTLLEVPDVCFDSTACDSVTIYNPSNTLQKISTERVSPAMLRKFQARGMSNSEMQRLKSMGATRNELRMLKRKYKVND